MITKWAKISMGCHRVKFWDHCYFWQTSLTYLSPQKTKLFLSNLLMIPVYKLQAQIIFRFKVILMQFLDNKISGSKLIYFPCILTNLISFILLKKSTCTSDIQIRYEDNFIHLLKQNIMGYLLIILFLGKHTLNVLNIN